VLEHRASRSSLLTVSGSARQSSCQLADGDERYTRCIVTQQEVKTLVTHLTCVTVGGKPTGDKCLSEYTSRGNGAGKR
jgi:hypothetical protein